MKSLIYIVFAMIIAVQATYIEEEVTLTAGGSKTWPLPTDYTGHVLLRIYSETGYYDAGIFDSGNLTQFTDGQAATGVCTAENASTTSVSCEITGPLTVAIRAWNDVSMKVEIISSTTDSAPIQDFIGVYRAFVKTEVGFCGETVICLDDTFTYPEQLIFTADGQIIEANEEFTTETLCPGSSNYAMITAETNFGYFVGYNSTDYALLFINHDRLVMYNASIWSIFGEIDISFALDTATGEYEYDSSYITSCCFDNCVYFGLSATSIKLSVYGYLERDPSYYIENFAELLGTWEATYHAAVGICSDGSVVCTEPYTMLGNVTYTYEGKVYYGHEGATTTTQCEDLSFAFYPSSNGGDFDYLNLYFSSANSLYTYDPETGEQYIDYINITTVNGVPHMTDISVYETSFDIVWTPHGNETACCGDCEAWSNTTIATVVNSVKIVPSTHIPSQFVGTWRSHAVTLSASCDDEIVCLNETLSYPMTVTFSSTGVMTMSNAKVTTTTLCPGSTTVYAEISESTGEYPIMFSSYDTETRVMTLVEPNTQILVYMTVMMDNETDSRQIVSIAEYNITSSRYVPTHSVGVCCGTGCQTGHQTSATDIFVGYRVLNTTQIKTEIGQFFGTWSMVTNASLGICGDNVVCTDTPYLVKHTMTISPNGTFSVHGPATNSTFRCDDNSFAYYPASESSVISYYLSYKNNIMTLIDGDGAKELYWMNMTPAGDWSYITVFNSTNFDYVSPTGDEHTCCNDCSVANTIVVTAHTTKVVDDAGGATSAGLASASPMLALLVMMLVLL